MVSKLVIPDPQSIEDLAPFMGLTEEDFARIQAAAPVLAPLVDGVVDAVYDWIFRFPHLHALFTNEEGNLDEASLAVRKASLKEWILRLVTGPYDRGHVRYQMVVGRAHKGGAGTNKGLHIPPSYLLALMGWVQGFVIEALFSLIEDRTELMKTTQAFTRLLMLEGIWMWEGYDREA